MVPLFHMMLTRFGLSFCNKLKEKSIFVNLRTIFRPENLRQFCIFTQAFYGKMRKWFARKFSKNSKIKFPYPFNLSVPFLFFWLASLPVNQSHLHTYVYQANHITAWGHWLGIVHSASSHQHVWRYGRQTCLCFCLCFEYAYVYWLAFLSPGLIPPACHSHAPCQLTGSPPI